MRSSRNRFDSYREKVRTRYAGESSENSKDRPQKQQARSFLVLLRRFLRLLRGHRGAILIALTTLTVATGLKLVPPYGLKLAIDHVLTDGAQPSAWIQTHLTNDRFQLLLFIAVGVASSSILASGIHLWGRWFATKTVNRVQSSLRKIAFAHAVRLPLNRVFELKSGGAASLLREDTGGAADLVFSMLYNPWRAIVQLVGSLIVLVLVDWRMMVGGLLLLPLVYVTHRTWIRANSTSLAGWCVPSGRRSTVTPPRLLVACVSFRAFARERTENRPLRPRKQSADSAATFRMAAYADHRLHMGT